MDHPSCDRRIVIGLASVIVLSAVVGGVWYLQETRKEVLHPKRPGRGNSSTVIMSREQIGETLDVISDDKDAVQRINPSEVIALLGESPQVSEIEPFRPREIQTILNQRSLK